MWSLPIDYDELYKVTNWFYTYALITHPPKKKKKKRKSDFPQIIMKLEDLLMF